ncbi:MAG: hypothetical protein JSW53_02535 [Candidatus Bathyarchaeota archaeon]|nr:MAG: hypothetical protein JSW53_02535 [Candidatus Bathyarchaeota archaeon]
MKKWEQIGMIGVFALTIGVILSAWGFLAVDEIRMEQIGDQVTATFDPTFVVLLMFGSFFVGLGIGELTSTYTIHKLEKQLASEDSN